MRSLTMPSPTPKHVADAYAAHVRELAGQASGKDGRLTQKEASQDPFIADAYARTGKQRPVIETVAGAARAAMLAQASGVHGGDGRVSRADAAKMAPLFAQAFLAIRGAPAKDGNAELAAELGRIADGLLFMSESDDPYTPVHVRLAPGEKLDEATLKRVLTWDAEEGDDYHEYDPYPVEFQLQYGPSDDFWTDHDGLTPEEAAKHTALDTAMKQKFVETTANGESGKIWTVTVREEDSSRAPYYILGRTENGDLVGLKTWRTWT